ncbi:sigma-54-dependent Fis family transcriptional regulator [Oceanobacillus piezotolerans]|uniref:Sigma-54-dependent Fis family transcriptional regulator n=1 Tax=Oceanobacillus piezotolerans TaxID=2448030 RepID=A0A498DGL2_9BACI|nr:sigma-54-dependent Fis family transcriptional regulator [Oceanobacillus piezotolerans]RLL47081.1 sigma-54-dependent Fis family transcriptional regulator [Oceanobacillus piezotolerans]
MENLFTSMYSALDLNDDASAIRRSWEDFVTDHNYSTLQMPIRNDILDSWKRCHSDGINPLQTQAREGLTPIELEQLWTESELYHSAKPIIEAVFQKLIGTDYLITLNDEKGNMIYLKGEIDILRKTEKMNFTVGMDWSEAAAGTNAIGTSIITKTPIQIFATEHFCEGFHSMTCSSAPIFQPYTRKVLGVIDITGLWPNGQPHTLGLAVTIAQTIEQELTKLHIKKYNFLMEYYHQKKSQWKNDPMLVISNDFLLVNGSDKLLKTFEIDKMMHLNENHQLRAIVRKLNERKFDRTDLSTQLNNVELLGLRLDDVHRIQTSGETIGYVILFKGNLTDKAPAMTQVNPITKYNLVGESGGLNRVLYKVQKAATTDVPVLLIGETGTGKEEITRMIHQESRRKKQPFIAMNCGAIQKDLIGSELFGYESGTFTGGNKGGKNGRFEAANGGTLFLDEIGEMPFDQQVHLLRVLEEKEITRLGSSKTIKVDVRIIAATNQNLQDMVEKGLFRKDLYFRLNVVSIEIPPLRERKEDILQLSNYFLAKFAKKYELLSPPIFDEETASILANYHWEGNIRELRNVIEHAVIFSMSSAVINRTHLPDYLLKNIEDSPQKEDNKMNLSLMDNLEKQQIIELLQMKNWNISAVSKELSIARSTLYRKIQKYQLAKT